jgi:hypothetical protein
LGDLKLFRPLGRPRDGDRFVFASGDLNGAGDRVAIDFPCVLDREYVSAQFAYDSEGNLIIAKFGVFDHGLSDAVVDDTGKPVVVSLQGEG